jgi:outer membrane biosynthesis protein TonB
MLPSRRTYKSVAVNVKYYGSQGVGTAGNLQSKSTSSAPNVAGAVVGAIIGICAGLCCLSIAVTIIIVVVVRLKKQKKPVKLAQVDTPLPDLEAPADNRIDHYVMYPIPSEYVAPQPAEVVEPNLIQLEEQPAPEQVVIQQEPEPEPVPEPTATLEQEPIQSEPEVVVEEEIQEEPEAPEPESQVTLNIESDLVLDEEGKKVLGEMKDIITDIRTKVSKITNKNISELQAYATPPPVVFSVLRSALIVLGYNADELSKWGACKKGLKDGFLKKIAQFDPTDRSHANSRFKPVQAEIADLDYETCLKKGSLPTAILFEWIKGTLQIRSMAEQLRSK